jgi:hypothetical protein
MVVRAPCFDKDMAILLTNVALFCLSCTSFFCFQISAQQDGPQQQQQYISWLVDEAIL